VRDDRREGELMSVLTRWRVWRATRGEGGGGGEAGAVLTLKELRDAHACGPQVDRFRETFGDRVVVTEALVLRWARWFDVQWAARRLLGGVAAYTALYDDLRRESGIDQMKHGYGETGDQCETCEAERKIAAVAFARRFIAERG